MLAHMGEGKERGESRGPPESYLGASEWTAVPLPEILDKPLPHFVSVLSSVERIIVTLMVAGWCD